MASPLPPCRRLRRFRTIRTSRAKQTTDTASKATFRSSTIHLILERDNRSIDTERLSRMMFCSRGETGNLATSRKFNQMKIAFARYKAEVAKYSIAVSVLMKLYCQLIHPVYQERYSRLLNARKHGDNKPRKNTHLSVFFYSTTHASSSVCIRFRAL